MKRFLPLFALPGLCCLAVPLLTASDGTKEKWCDRHHPPASSGGCSFDPHARACAIVPAPRSIDAQLVQDLTTILSETTSRETYVYTVGVLGKMGRCARPAVPAIIRNAERLRLFTTNARGSEETLTAVTAAIDAILERSPATPALSVAKVTIPAPLSTPPVPVASPPPVKPAPHVCRPAPAKPQSAPPPLAASSAPRLVPTPAR